MQPASTDEAAAGRRVAGLRGNAVTIAESHAGLVRAALGARKMCPVPAIHRALLVVAVVLSACRREPPPPSAVRPATVASAADAPPPASPTPAPPAAGARPSEVVATALLPADAALLDAWYEKVGARRPDEAYGALVVRAAMAQLGRPYLDPPAPAGPERMEIRLRDFQCVSLVESSLSVARCLTLGEADAPCFVREVEGFRYRDGTLGDFASKLHYFSEWVTDNARRGRLRELSYELGGRPTPTTYDFMTRHRGRYAPMAEADVFAAVERVERDLATQPLPVVVGRGAVKAAQARLETGDVLALTGTRPGLIVSHAALVYVDLKGVRHLLHASSTQRRVMMQTEDIASYVLRRPERTGFMAARPLPPPLVAASAPAR